MRQDEQVTPAILLARMPQQTEVRAQDDDWTGRTDARARRKLQNRLNQRIWRSRRREEREALKFRLADATQDVESLPKEVESSDESTPRSQQLEAANVRTGTIECVRQNVCFHKLDTAGILELMKQYEVSARQAHMLGSPRVDQLLTLIQFNVFRALISNTSTIGFTMEWLQEDAISPWNSTYEPVNPSCPASLQPSPIQREISHHPWIDLFPIPQMRDNMLLAGDTYDEYELCNDLVDFCDVPNERTGLIVWGEPWDPSGWEISESFLNRWGWVVKGCVELLASTNYWRAQRGESELVFKL